MDSEDDIKRYEALMEGMKELMSGNFSIQLHRSEKEDDLEALTVRFNMMAQKLNKYYSSFAFHKPEHSSLFLSNLILDLDEEFKVVGASKAIKSILKYDLKDIENKPFLEILSERSLPNWERMTGGIIQPKIEQSSQKLWFKTIQDLTVPAYCFISEKEDTSLSNTKYSLHAFEAVILEEVYDEYFPMDGNGDLFHIKSEYADILLRPSEIAKMEEVHEYVLSHLEHKLPRFSDLAEMFNINEHKLKRNFKWVYDSTPHQLHKETRLERSHELLINSDLAFKSIALKYAFPSASYFSRAIKKKYGLSPTEVRNTRNKKRKKAE